MISFVEPADYLDRVNRTAPQRNRRAHGFLAIRSQLEQPERLLALPKGRAANIQHVAEPLKFDRTEAMPERECLAMVKRITTPLVPPGATAAK